ncbi:phosphatase PAP2 family protein [Paenibacillus marinisediminis]
MKQKLIAYSPLAWLLAIPILNVFYGILNQGSPHVTQLITAWDHFIPFVPSFIIPYLIWYPYIFLMLVVFFRKDRSVYYRSLTLTCIGLVICFLIYSIFQTMMLRPEIGSDGMLNWLVRFVYSTDAPYNCFPSIHVLTSHIVLKAAYQCKLSRRATTATFITSWMIILSTLFVKQHVLMDAVGGILLSEMLYYVIGRKIFGFRKMERVSHEI